MVINNPRQQGFALIVSMIILAVMSILVVNAVRNTTLSEKMAGSYMDRNLAQQAAEQALRQGQAILLANGALCVSGCAVSSAGVVSAAVTPTALPSNWDNNAGWNESLAASINKSSGQLTSGKYQVTLLPNSALPSGKSLCKAYSVMGKGVGLDTRSIVILQTVAVICPV